MEHRKEDGSLDVELETSVPQKLLDDALAAGLLPEPAKDQGRPEMRGPRNRESTLGMSGKQEYGVSQASA
jgi:hypothetical protein